MRPPGRRASARALSVVLAALLATGGAEPRASGGSGGSGGCGAAAGGGAAAADSAADSAPHSAADSAPHSAADSALHSAADSAAALPAVTLPAGLHLEYGLSLGPIHAGHASLGVGPPRQVDGVEANRVTLSIEGGGLFLRLDDSLSSWIATEPLRTLRSVRRLHEGPHRDAYRIELTGAGGRYRIVSLDRGGDADAADGPARDDASGPMPPVPLDQLAVLFLPRALALEEGSERAVDQFFECRKNPIRVRVLGRERLRTPAGRFDVVRLGVVIPNTGLFAPKRKARVYVTDDTARTVVQLTAHTGLGTLKLYLTGRGDG